MAGEEEKDEIDPTEESWWKLGPWLVVLALVGIVVCWVVGLIGPIVLGDPLRSRPIGLPRAGISRVEDHVRYVVVALCGAVLSNGPTRWKRPRRSCSTQTSWRPQGYTLGVINFVDVAWASPQGSAAEQRLPLDAVRG
jgi:hypothetical protein